MNHGMTIRTYRKQVFHGINLIFMSDAAQRDEVVDMDIAITNARVRCRKVEAADLAR